MTELRRITERYRLDKQVAASDAGSVFRGTDIQSGATVAVKLINSDGGESDEQRERFLENAGLLQSLQHPSLPRVVDFGFTTAGSAFLVTEFLHGSSFEEVAGSAPGRVISLLLLVVDGVEAMGSRNISPRNLRADNLFVVPGEGGEQIKILGLGSAVLEPGAMPVLDGYAEDLRAFGLLSCRMLRVQTDFKVGIPLEVAVELEDIEALRALLEAALHGDPEGHYPSWAEVRKALRSALFGQTGAPPFARTEAFATHPGLAAEGAPAPTLQIQRPQAGWDNPPARPEPAASVDPNQGTMLIPRSQPQSPPPPAPGGGTMLISSPWAAAKAPRVDADLDSTMMVPDDLPWATAPEPLSATKAGATGGGETARFQMPSEATPRSAPPSPVEAPVPPAVPPAPPKRRLPETTEIPAARFPVAPPKPPKPPAPLPTPESMASTLEIPRAVVQEVMARPAPSAPPPVAAPKPVPPPPPPVPVVPEPPPPRAVEPLWAPPPAPEPAPPPYVPTPPPPPAYIPPPPPPPEEVGVDTIARPPEVRVVPPIARRQRRLLLIGIPAAAVLLLGLGLGLFWFLRRAPEPPPKPKVVVQPVAPPPVAAPAPAPAPLPVHPQLALAQTSLGAGDLKGVKTALDAITPADQAAFRPDEKELYQRLADSLTPLKREELASNLARALERGDLRQLRSLADAVPAADQASLPPDVQANLAKARKAVGIDSGLSRAQKAGNPLEVIHQADLLLAELPRASRAADQKERAAGSIETAADSEIDAAQYDAALNHLNGLRQVWPDRAGLAARTERVAAERKADQDQESLLGAVSAAERSNKPLEAQRLLAGVRPSRRYAEKIQEARQRVDKEVAQLDRQPPVLALHGNPPEYDKGKTATIPLTITDDFGVKSVEGWARPEKGQYAKVTIRHLNGSDYAMDVPENVHKNETIEYYATATDASGHIGQLASADHPNKVKRKGFLKQIFGGKEGG